QARAVAIGADLLSCASYQMANIGRPSDAMSLDRAAVEDADGVTGRARALLLDRLAWAYARAGENRRCYVELRRPLRAVPVLLSAIESYPAEPIRETALYRTWLAEAYVQANEHDAARATLESATALAHGTHSERLRARIRDVAAQIAV
ncbi:MAG TPA: hypothetical protein VI076_02320, partial [Actinopolymorphaceae bacterium]